MDTNHPTLFILFILAFIIFSISNPALSSAPKDLPLPSANPTAFEIAEQVYFVNHLYAFKNYGATRSDDEATIIINKKKNKKISFTVVERYVNNDYDDGIIKSKDISFFRSGKLNGTGLLITEYVDTNKSQSFSIWLPSLRKIRRFAQPAHNDSWGGTDFTFGDVLLRKPTDETHEIIGLATFKGCLGFIPNVTHPLLKIVPQPACHHDGKNIFKLKSSTKFQDWWYDYRVSYVDSKTFADYRVEFFKDEILVKVIDKNWRNLKESDVRAQTWGYWYGKTIPTEHETWAIIPPNTVKINHNWEKTKWTEKTLRKIKR